MAKFSAASIAKLNECDRLLQLPLYDAIEIIDFTIIQGFRNKEDQEKAFKEGKTKLHWPFGNHNQRPSTAIDIAPVYYESGMKIDWNDLIAFGRLMGIIQACAWKRSIKLRFGLDWDGDFRSVRRDPDEDFLDAPHVELLDARR